MKKQVDYFREAREILAAIPDDRWCKGAIKRDGRCCAVGHLVATARPPEFWAAFGDVSLSAVNDAPGSPKENVLAFLDELIREVTA